MMANEVEQAIRRSHCDRKGHEHECVGTCTIGPSGVTLECPLCGTGDVSFGPREYVDSKFIEQAKWICEDMGIAWSSLATEFQVRLVERVKRMMNRV